MTAKLHVYEDSGCTVPTLIRVENTSGAPINRASIIEAPNQGAGNSPPDTLAIRFSCDADNNWTADVTRKDGSIYSVGKVAINGDDADNIIPGVALSITDLDPSQTYSASVFIGWNPGIIKAGDESKAKRMWVKNVGESDGYDARIRILPDGDFQNVVGNPIRAINESKYVWNTLIGTFNIIVQSKENVAVSFEGGSPFGRDIIADGETGNELADGLWVIFNPDIAEDDSANIYISDGRDRVQIAEDDSGTPGQFWLADIVFGTMDRGDTGSFWVKIVTQAQDSPLGNPRHANLQARITTI